jgi:hypothetical protein
MLQTKAIGKMKKYISFNKLSENLALCGIMLKDMVYEDRPQIIIKITVHALCMLDK